MWLLANFKLYMWLTLYILLVSARLEVNQSKFLTISFIKFMIPYVEFICNPSVNQFWMTTLFPQRGPPFLGCGVKDEWTGESVLGRIHIQGTGDPNSPEELGRDISRCLNVWSWPQQPRRVGAGDQSLLECVIMVCHLCHSYFSFRPLLGFFECSCLHTPTYTHARATVAGSFP